METSTKYTLHYTVQSPKGAPWQRSAGPFASIEEAQIALSCKSKVVGIVAYRIVCETVTTEVVDEFEELPRANV